VKWRILITSSHSDFL